MDKQIASTKRNKRERMTDACNSVNESQMYYAQWKNSVSKGYIQFDSIYMTFWRRQKCRNREQTSGFQGSKVRRGSDYGLARNSVHLTKAQNRNGYLSWRGRDGAWTPRGIFMGTDQTVSKYTSTHSESPPIYLYAVHVWIRRGLHPEYESLSSSDNPHRRKL